MMINIKKNCKLQSFSTAFRQYSSLVKIRKVGRYHLYGSAKLTDEAIDDYIVRLKQSKKKKKPKVVVRPTIVESKQLNFKRTPESVLLEINEIMQQASSKIDKLVSKFKSPE